MSAVTMEAIKQQLGRKFNETHEYKIAKQRDVAMLELRGYHRVDQIPDSTQRDSGHMVVMSKKMEDAA